MRHAENWLARGTGATSRIIRDAVVLALTGKRVLLRWPTIPCASRLGYERLKSYAVREMEIPGVRPRRSTLTIEFPSGGFVRCGNAATVSDGFDVTIDDPSIQQRAAIKAGTHHYVEQTLPWAFLRAKEK